MTDEETRLIERYKRLSYKACEGYKKARLETEAKDELIAQLRARIEDLEEQIDKDDLALDYYKRAECPFYQHGGKCIDKTGKADYKDIRQRQRRNYKKEVAL